jgi:hypothetical protein
MKPARMKPARLSRQTSLASNQIACRQGQDYTRNLRQACVRLNAKREAADERGSSAGKRQTEVEAGAGMNGKPPDPEARTEAGESKTRELPPAARRALAEAEARRVEAKPTQPAELNGRGGLDPARYGDWEVKGIASDF